MKYLKVALIFIVVAVISFLLGLHFAPKPPIVKEIRDNSDDYTYINPLISVSLGSKDQFPEYTPLANKIRSYIDSEDRIGDIASTSVYFRDLNSDKWTGVNEDVPYAPSSMLKVVVMLAYLDHAEDDPSILNQTYDYVQQYNSTEYFKPQQVLAPGPETVENLLKNMIINSDDDAYVSLVKNDTDGRIETVNKMLRLPEPATDDITNDFMSAHAYSLVFRTLYNATYLSRSVSEQALKLLTETTFTQGLVAGVPPGTVVAHKFGERTAVDQSGTVTSRELHDCGIVYVPDNPYLLCIMTKGSDFTKLAGVISHISSIVYSDVEGK